MLQDHEFDPVSPEEQARREAEAELARRIRREVRRMERGELRRILFCATGALMSPTSSQQGESIPSIAHAVCLTSRKEDLPWN